MNENLISKIFQKIKKAPHDAQAYEDMFDLCRAGEEADRNRAHEVNAELRGLISAAIKARYDVERFFSLYRRSLLFDAPYSFDAYLLYLEIDREPSKRFYQPRRKVLKRVVDALQRLSDGDLDELVLSMPPRVGKTSLLMFFTTWIIGRNSEASNLYSAYSDTITKAFYNGVLEIINDPMTYLWKDVFPEAKVVQTNSADETINVDRKKRYPSLTCRSLYGTLNGACDCGGFLISDDLIGGIEEALNKDRLEAAWSKVDNNLLPRAKETAKILWCGTRWSLSDPIGKRLELLETRPEFEGRRWEVITLPALDENDESNFDYDYGVGFSTDFYKQRRASFEKNNDMASWFAGYCQEPIERQGALFTPGDMRYYNGELPDAEPDRIFMAVDPAFGGGDFVSSPVCFEYGDDIYVHDVVYDDSDKKITQPMLASVVERYDVAAMRFEANRSTEAYAEGVADLLKQKGIRINLYTKPAPSDKAKWERILDKAPDIRERMIFREPGTRSRPYDLFMQNIFSFKLAGKNKHDDAPDSLAMAIEMIKRGFEKAKAFKRPF